MSSIIVFIVSRGRTDQDLIASIMITLSTFSE